MGIISSREVQYITNLIDNGRESSILDFKEEWYKLEYRANQYEFIKDCISFLNVGMEVDKYIIIGVKENKVEGTFTIVGVNDRYEENNIQEIITENIEPIPQIDIITRVKIREYEIDIIKLRKENKDQPYLFKKDFSAQSKKYFKNDLKGETFQKVCRGLGYIRHGSSSHQISRNELTNMFFKKQGNIYGYFNLESDIKYECLNDIMIFLDCMDSMISKDSLDILSSNNVVFKSRLMNVFQELIIEGNLFNDNEDRGNLKEYVCKMILDNKNDYSRLKGVLDGGENSIIILMFCACYYWYKISKNHKIKCNISNDIGMIKFDDELLNGDEYREIDKYIIDLNDIINDMDNISLHYVKNIKIFKIRKIKYDSESSKYFVKSNIKFKVSEDIIPLLIEPLYKQGNKMEIALREMLQNSIDACKLAEREEYIGEIEVEVRLEENKTILIFCDNGIGMDLDDIEKYYLTVGKSKKTSSELPVVGQFGIGALSMFLVGKKAIVRTKKSDDNEYRFELFEDKITVSDLTKKICDSNESYTKIEIELDETVNSDNLQGLIKELGIDKWVVNKKNINIRFRFGEDLYQVPNINDRKEDFVTILETEKLLILLYDIDKENTTENKGAVDINLGNIVKTKNIMLYNDILTKAVYNFDNYRNINKSNIPFVIVAGKTTENEISIELSRNSANIGGTITEPIVQRIYQNEINKIIEYLHENQEKTNSIKMRSEITKLVRDYLKLPTLLLAKNKIIISNSKIKSELPNIKYVWVIYSNSLNDECVNFNENVWYIIEDINSNKSNIADMIEANKVALISKRFLYKYILHAKGSSNGFRMEALKVILKDIIPTIDWELNYIDLWKMIENKSFEIQQAIENKSIYGIYCYGKLDKNAISEMFSPKIQDRDLILSFRNIEDYSIKNSYDKSFDELFINAYSHQNSDVLRSVAVTLNED